MQLLYKQTEILTLDNNSIQTELVSPVALMAPYGIMLLRLALGVMYLAHASLKFFIFTLPGTAAYFSSVGFPGFLAYPVFAAEVAGGTAILLGIHTRFFSIMLLPVLLGALWVHFPNGWVHTSPGGGWEYPLFLVVASISQSLLGDGAYAFKSFTRLFQNKV